MMFCPRYVHQSEPWHASRFCVPTSGNAAAWRIKTFQHLRTPAKHEISACNCNSPVTPLDQQHLRATLSTEQLPYSSIVSLSKVQEGGAVLCSAKVHLQCTIPRAHFSNMSPVFLWIVATPSHHFHLRSLEVARTLHYE